jgi:hypothetical protein
MSKEVPLQADLFSGELVDTRTRKQKKRETERQLPVQAEMFSQREMAQFGVRAHPQIPLSPKTRIELALQDLRSQEEQEAARQREVERRSYRLPGFEEDSHPSDESEPEVKVSDHIETETEYE